MREHHTVRETTVTATIWLSGLIVIAVFFWVLIDLLVRGARPLSWEFLTTEPLDMGRRGGILPIILSTLLILAVCMAVTVPLGLGTAVFLSEYTSERRPFGRAIRSSLDVLAAVPSVVFGLFGAALFGRYLGMGYSILGGGLTLACMVLPIFIRSAEQGLRAVPDDLRLGAAGLGLSRWSTLTKVLLPSAMPMLIAAFVLGVGRALAETAALIFTSGEVTRMPESLMDSGRAMSVHIYLLAMGVMGGDRNAYACALVLVGLLLLINLVAAWIGERSRKAFTNEA